MKLKAVHCLGCGDGVYSRAPQDFRHCSCGSVFVDGGREYFKDGSAPGAELETTEVDVDTTMETLYRDWEEMHDTYGVVHV